MTTLEWRLKRKERIDDVLIMLNDPPQNSNDEGVKELASKQHRMWIAELLDNSWSSNVSAKMSAFKEETKGDGILLFYLFLCENIGYTKEAIIAAEQQLSKEKLALENFNFDIGQFTKHARTYHWKIMNAGTLITNQHCILVFLALKEAEDEEFRSIIMRLYKGWRTGNGEGSNMSIIQLLAHADSEYKRLTVIGQWKTKAKSSELLEACKLNSTSFRHNLLIRTNHLRISQTQIKQLGNLVQRRRNLE